MNFVVVDQTEGAVTIEASVNSFSVTATSLNEVAVVEVQPVALPVHTNIDGGVAQSIYGGISPIDGGGAN